jgi:hypothetical protein
MNSFSVGGGTNSFAVKPVQTHDTGKFVLFRSETRPALCLQEACAVSASRRGHRAENHISSLIAAPLSSSNR